MHFEFNSKDELFQETMNLQQWWQKQQRTK